VQDWHDGDPTWQDGKGKGLIGAINYLSDTGCNAFSFLTYNVDGDGSNVWPYIHPRDKMRFDCSKLDQWAVIFDHATTKGMYLHFKLQETEIDDHRKKNTDFVKAALDGGKLGPERRVYLRELIARYGYLLALNWNLGEETTQTPEEQRDMAQYIADTDPYQHHRVIHTYPGQQEQRYPPLLGDQSALTGASLQNRWDHCHKRALRWLKASAEAGKPWVVAQDEQNGANTGAPPDMGYQGWDGTTPDGKTIHTADDIRKYTLWGNLMAGGAGVEYYFGYQLPENDLKAEDWRSRASSWKYAAIALNFFREHEIPFWEMSNANTLIGNNEDNNSRYCFAMPGEVYLVYLPKGGTTELDLSNAEGSFSVQWFNTREGGELTEGSVTSIKGGATAKLGNAPKQPKQDWLVMVRSAK
ncbi:MAG: putative collagen-binding domain-containing protein, partial [Planctomycetota bacterium]